MPKSRKITLELDWSWDTCTNRDHKIFMNTWHEMCRFQSVYNYLEMGHSMLKNAWKTGGTGCCPPYSQPGTAERKEIKWWKIGNPRLDRLKVIALKKKILHERIFLSTVVQIIFLQFSVFSLCLCFFQHKLCFKLVFLRALKL